LSLGLQSDFSWYYGKYALLENDILRYDEQVKQNALNNVFRMINTL